MATRVLMFGWEFPPHQVGGLGVVSQALAHALEREGVEVTFVLPRKQDVDSHLRFIFADVPYGAVESGGGVYTTMKNMQCADDLGHVHHMFKDFIDQLYEYARQAKRIAAHEKFDVIHAHDWLTYLAGLAAREVSGKPLVVHVHNTIFDRGLGNASDVERAIESRGICEADGVVTVSQYTKEKIVKNYGVDQNKVTVVHNAINPSDIAETVTALEAIRAQGMSIVLYHGRVTLQKGVEYFVQAARKVLEFNKDVLFIISGWGDDMRTKIIQDVAYSGLSEHFLFIDSAWGKDRDSLYRSADVLVMPSVSEPFGIVPLEALAQGTPVIISKQSGVAEVLPNALKVDFWDTDEMANKMLAVIEHLPLRHELTRRGKVDAGALSWGSAAAKCKTLYNQVMSLFVLPKLS